MLAGILFTAWSYSSRSCFHLHILSVWASVCFPFIQQFSGLKEYCWARHCKGQVVHRLPPPQMTSVHSALHVRNRRDDENIPALLKEPQWQKNLRVTSWGLVSTLGVRVCCFERLLFVLLVTCCHTLARQLHSILGHLSWGHLVQHYFYKCGAPRKENA